MKTYYNTKTKQFEQLKEKSKSNAKILLTVEILETYRKGIYGIYGQLQNPGQFYSTINGIDFLWNDLRMTLLDPPYDIEILNPDNYDDRICIKR